MLTADRSIRRWSLGLLTGVALLTGGSAGADQEAAHDETVKIEGCPVPGVETGCMILKAKDGTVYEIGSAEPKPRVGYRVISLTGQKSTGISFCMQGTRLEKIKWSYKRGRCPAPAPAQP